MDFGDALMRVAAATNGAASAQKYNNTAALAQLAGQQADGTQDPNLSKLAQLAAASPEIAGRNYADALGEQQKLALQNPLGTALANYGKGVTNTTPGAPQAQAGEDPYLLKPESADDKRNYDFLNNVVPPAYRAQVRAISNGDESVGNADSLRANGLLTLATNFDPSLSKTDFTSRQATAKDFSSGGKSGQALTSINTATKHLAQVALAGLDLHNGNNRVLNYLGNEGASLLGDEKLTNLKSTVQTVAPELAKAAASGGDTTESERRAQGDSFGGASSPTQILGAVAGKVDLMQSKADEIGKTYKTNFKREPKVTINPENAQTLNDLKQLHSYAQVDKLDTPEAQAIVQRLRAVTGQTTAAPTAPTAQPGAADPEYIAKLVAKAKAK